MAKASKVKVEAVIDFKMDKKETGKIAMYGLEFDCAKGKATGSFDAELVESLIDAGKLKKAK